MSLPGSPFPTIGSQPNKFTYANSGAYLYVVHVSTTDPTTPGNVSGFRVDPATGALTPVPGSPFVGGNFMVSIAGP